MTAEETAKFLEGLAKDLNSKNISLPSFPDVVIRIRSALEDPGCTADRLAGVAKTDPVLASRLLISANSAFHNRAGISIVDLDLAISRLGFEAVRNTAIALAVEQIFTSTRHAELHERLEKLWSRSMALSSMCYVLAQGIDEINPDNAYLAGLLHEIGKLYILTKSRDFPRMLGDDESLGKVIAAWYPSIGKSIVESWGFPQVIADSITVSENLNTIRCSKASLVDVVYTAIALLDRPEETLDREPLHPAVTRVIRNKESYPLIKSAFEQHSGTVHRSVSD